MRRLLAVVTVTLGAALGTSPGTAAAAPAPPGPDSVRTAPVTARPGTAAPVSATVLTAAGRPVAGALVTFTLAGATATATTGADGVAHGTLAAPAAAGTLTATVSGAPAGTATGRAPFTPALHPDPRLTLTAGGGLVLAGAGLEPAVTVTGTYGFTGAGSIEVRGPVAPGDGGCAPAAGGALAAAPVAWTGAFTVAADGPQDAGAAPTLAPGCYALRATLTTADATPAVTVRTAPVVAAVSPLAVTQSVGTGYAPPGPLTATIAATPATAAAGADLATSVTVSGPVAPGADGCTGLTWPAASAATAAPTPPSTAVTEGRGSHGTVTVRTAAVTRPGCYALATRTTVMQDGLSAVVTTHAGDAGTVVRVVAPAVTVDDDAYDGRLGVPMTGTVHVSGTSGLPGHVTVGLQELAPAAGGCRAAAPDGAAQPAAAVTPVGATPVGGTAGGTVVAVTGDGAYAFRTPVPAANRCYAVTATLVLSADAALSATAPPGAASVFLAGAEAGTGPESPRPVTTRPRGAGRTSHELAVLGGGAGAVLLVALALLVTGAVAGDRRPDPAARALLAALAPDGDARR